MTQHLDLPVLTTKKAKKGKLEKSTTLPPEELARRYAAAKARAAANREKTKERGKLSDEEQENLRKQEYAAKKAKKAVAYEARWERSHAARMQFCLYGGLACLILTPSRLDPTIGAAACQQYAMLAVVYRSMLQVRLSASEWLAVENSCKSFIGEAALHDRSNLLPTTDYELPDIPHDLQSLYDKAQTIFSSTQLRYLQLALALWESSVLSFDEFDQVCRLRGNAALGKYEAELRSEFSCLADKLYIEEISCLPPSHEQAIQLYTKTTSKYYMDAAKQYPVMCPSVFATFYLNQALAWHHDFLIAIGMTRVGIHQPSHLPTTTAPSSHPSRYSYSLAFTDIYYYHRTIPPGSFKMITTPTETDLARPCLFFDCVGTSFVTSNPSTTISQTTSRAAFQQINPTWLLLSWAAGHPDLAKRASPSSSTPLDAAVRAIYTDPVRHATYDERDLTFSIISADAAAHATPAELLHYSRRQAEENKQTGEHYFNDITVGKDAAVPRTRAEMRFHVVHVQASVGKIEEERRRAVRGRHDVMGTAGTGTGTGLGGGAVARGLLGGYIFTNGKAGHSCWEREEAVAFQEGGSGSRILKYKAAYPEMAPFCGGVRKGGGVEKGAEVVLVDRE